MEDENEQLCLKWKTHHTTIVSAFDALLQNGTLVDCTLAAEGQFLGAHKLVLSACSPLLANLLAQPYDKHPIFILKDVTFKELRAIMDYMYRGEVNIEQDQLSGLIKAAESLQIKGLSKNQQTGGGQQQTFKSEQKEDPKQPKITAAAAKPATVNLEATSDATSIATSRKRRIIIATRNVNESTVSSSQSQKPQSTLPPKGTFLLRNQRDSEQPSEDDASDENEDNQEPPTQRPKITNFECPECDNTYMHIHSLRRHLVKQHKRQKPTKQKQQEDTLNSVHSDELIDVEALGDWDDDELLIETKLCVQPEHDPLLNEDILGDAKAVKTPSMPSYECPECGRTYQSYRSLDRHQKQYNHMQPNQRQNYDESNIDNEYKAPEDEESSSEDEDWIDPAQDNGPSDNENTIRFYCPFCIYSGKYKRYLRTHLLRKHRSRFTHKLYESLTPK